MKKATQQYKKKIRSNSVRFFGESKYFTLREYFLVKEENYRAFSKIYSQKRLSLAAVIYICVFVCAIIILLTKGTFYILKNANGSIFLNLLGVALILIIALLTVRLIYRIKSNFSMRR
jgi:hypothetical protein